MTTETKRKPTSIHISGRRWRDTHGNIYHTVSICVDGKPAHTSEITYGRDL